MKILIFQFMLLSFDALAQNPTRLATDYKAIRDVINHSTEAYIAVFKSFGPPDAGSPGESVYADAQLSLIRPIKGSNEAKIVSCSLNVTTHPPELKEELPKLGVEYIAVGEPGKSRFVIAKLLEYSDENVKLISTLFQSILKERKSAVDSAANQSLTKVQNQPIIQSSAPNKAPTNSTTSTPNKEPTPSTPWSIIVALIVAACGLLWLLLKRRS